MRGEVETGPQEAAGADLVPRCEEWYTARAAWRPSPQRIPPSPAFCYTFLDLDLGTRWEGERVGNRCQGNPCGTEQMAYGLWKGRTGLRIPYDLLAWECQERPMKCVQASERQQGNNYKARAWHQQPGWTPGSDR